MAAHSASPMIFVTGAPRSGTMLAAQMLGRHSEVADLRELRYFGEYCDPRRDEPDAAVDKHDAVARLFDRQNRGIPGARERPLPDADADRVLEALPERAGAAEVFAAAAAAIAAREGRSLPCEQTPGNIDYAAALLDWYPRARFVHMLRDPRAVMASRKYRWHRSPAADPAAVTRVQALRAWVRYHPYTMTRLWSQATRLALELEGHPRFVLLKLEDLILQPERRMRAVCDFLGISFQPEMLDIGHVDASHVSGAGIRRGLSRDTIDAWRDRLSSDERALVNERCGDLMRRVGYEPEPAAGSRVGSSAIAARYALHVGAAALVNRRRLWGQGRAAAWLPAPHRRAYNSCRGDAGRANGYGAANEDVRRADGRAGDDGEVPRTDVLGLPCSDVPLEHAARHLAGCAAAGHSRRVSFVNAHTLNVSMRDPELREALHDSDIIYADGVGMAMAARMQGRRLLHNVNGTDLFPLLCQEAARQRVPIALFGAAPGVVEACRTALQARHPALEIAWCHHGYVSAGEETARVLDEINASGARILLVAMGVPRQERWIREHSAKLRVPVVMGVGGLFDFTSGRVPRAPRSFRRLRLEWMFRLMIEPRRLFVRYALGNPLFLARALRYAVTGHLGGAPSHKVPSR